jgi:hypothetical protein
MVNPQLTGKKKEPPAITQNPRNSRTANRDKLKLSAKTQVFKRGTGTMCRFLPV